MTQNKIKLTYFGKTEIFEGKVKLSSLLPSDNTEYICARINGRLRDLNYEIYYDADINFLSLKDHEAVKIYEASLRYLLAMSISKLYPDLKFKFGYNISRSIYINFLDSNFKINSKIISNISNKMKEIVSKDLPLNRSKVSNEEAAKIYKENGLIDKLDILPYRPEKTVHLYECDGYLNYMFSHMVPSTRYLNKFNLFQYNPGMILQYPRSETNGELPLFIDAPVYRKTLEETHEYSSKTGLNFVADINKRITNDGPVDFINLCEARHNKLLNDLGNEIEKRIANIKLICIAGPSSSGKTTFSNKLRIELLSRGFHPVKISIDDYYLDRKNIPLGEDGKQDFECLESLDIKQFNEDMTSLIKGKEVTLPKYDFKTGTRKNGNKLKLNDGEVIIIEGIHALNEKFTYSIPKKDKYKIFIAPQAQINLDNVCPLSLTDLRLLRRIVRDNNFRGFPPEDTLEMWPKVRQGEFKWIYDTQENADFVFNSFLSYELCVMKKYAEPLLNKFTSDSKYYPTVERLKRFLKYFVSMDDEWVPCNSIIREFIGGSCYADV